MSKQAHCDKHGAQGIGLVCTHVAHAIDTAEPVGFFWGEETDTARPDAWCVDCERRRRQENGVRTDQWYREGDFKILCAACWDEARFVMYDRFRH